MAPTKVKLHTKSGKLKVISSNSSSPIGPVESVTNRNISSSLISQNNGNNSTTNNYIGPSDADYQFEIELTWCIQQLQESLKSGKLNEKQVHDTEKMLKVLKSSNQPIIKKRQIMKSTFGDYRLKMQEEEKKLGLRSKQIKFNLPATNNIKSFFVKRSVISNSEKNFKFNFPLSEIENLNICNENDSSKKKGSETENFQFVPSNNTFKFNFTVENT